MEDKKDNWYKTKGTIAMCLAVALIIAGASGITAYFLDVESATTTPKQEVTLNEAIESEEDILADADSGVSDADSYVYESLRSDVTKDSYCNVIMVGVGSGFSDEPKENNTVMLSAALCVEVLASLYEYTQTGVIPHEEISFPNWLR